MCFSMLSIRKCAQQFAVSVARSLFNCCLVLIFEFLGRRMPAAMFYKAIAKVYSAHTHTNTHTDMHLMKLFRGQIYYGYELRTRLSHAALSLECYWHFKSTFCGFFCSDFKKELTIFCIDLVQFRRDEKQIQDFFLGYNCTTIIHLSYI